MGNVMGVGANSGMDGRGGRGGMGGVGVGANTKGIFSGDSTTDPGPQFGGKRGMPGSEVQKRFKTISKVQKDA